LELFLQAVISQTPRPGWQLSKRSVSQAVDVAHAHVPADIPFKFSIGRATDFQKPRRFRNTSGNSKFSEALSKVTFFGLIAVRRIRCAYGGNYCQARAQNCDASFCRGALLKKKTKNRNALKEKPRIDV